MTQDSLEHTTCRHVKVTKLLNSNAEPFEFEIKLKNDESQNEKKSEKNIKDAIQVVNAKTNE